MVTNIGPSIGKMEQMDIGSPARPTPIPVCFTIFRLYIIYNLSVIDKYRGQVEPCMVATYRLIVSVQFILIH